MLVPLSCSAPQDTCIDQCTSACVIHGPSGLLLLWGWVGDMIARHDIVTFDWWIINAVDVIG